MIATWCGYFYWFFVLRRKMSPQKTQKAILNGNHTVCVAVIDSGIDPSCASLAPIRAYTRIGIDAGGVPVHYDDWHDTTGHGTAVSGIICKDGIRENIELLSIKITSDSVLKHPHGAVLIIAEAIRWSVLNKARVINISAGVEQWRPEDETLLHRACREARKVGCIIIVSAAANSGSSIPAGFDEVITVDQAECGPEDILLPLSGTAEFLAKGDPQRVHWLGGKEILLEGPSLATAHVSRMVSRLLLQNPGLTEMQIRKLLKQKALPDNVEARHKWQAAILSFYQHRSPSQAAFIRRAVIYPFNKETHSLVRFRDMLHFEIIGVVDPIGMRTAGRDAGELIGVKFAGLPIQTDLFKTLRTADTLILGHMEALGNMGAAKKKEWILEKALTDEKHIFSLSKLDMDRFAGYFRKAKEKGLIFTDPNVTTDERDDLLNEAKRLRTIDGCEQYVVSMTSGKMLGRKDKLGFIQHLQGDQSSVPSLGIFGTSRNQGKFTLQIGLRQALSSRGYRVAHLATEPTGMLLNASASLPYGYKSGAIYSAEGWSFLAQVLMGVIEREEKPDLIIVGGQSGMAAARASLLRTFSGSPLVTIGFGMGALPDACILVCNLFDDPYHVQRCIEVIRSTMLSRIIALGFSNQSYEDYVWHGIQRQRIKRLSEAEMEIRLKPWIERFHYPCLNASSQKGVHGLSDIVVAFYSTSYVAERG
jgi:uncharacterized NAD-dependent epimerase/dehydratase family protein